MLLKSGFIHRLTFLHQKLITNKITIACKHRYIYCLFKELGLCDLSNNDSGLKEDIKDVDARD